MNLFSNAKRLQVARQILTQVAEKMDATFSVRLWDGSIIPLGKHVEKDCLLAINGPNTISTLVRRPTLDNLIHHYAAGKISFHGNDLISVLQRVRRNENKKRLKTISKLLLLKAGLVFLLSPSEPLESEHAYGEGQSGLKADERNNKNYIQFHYNVGNDFYKLFLDPNMQYSCGYFQHADDTLEQAQVNKLDIICRKLQLKPGERLLDIGSGWGGLIIYASQQYGVKAHGVTLSDAQYAYTREKIKELGLSDRVSVELCDYQALKGTYDKIVSVGMFEHIGLANIPAYFNKINSLLIDRGLLLNHAITRRAKASKKKFLKVRREMKALQKFIFPGGALDHIGHSVESMEIQGLEVRDVESWREHYAMTLRYWCERLMANEKEAIRLVGPRRYRLWVGYLAGVSLGFIDGYSNIYQTVAVKRAKKGVSGLPLTRSAWYQEVASQQLEPK